MRILLAEGDPDHRSTLQGLLERWEYEVVTAAGGREALRILEADGTPRIAILDGQLPGLDGVEICRRLRELPDRNPPYLILLAGDPGGLRRALEAGADDCLVRPVGPEALLALRAAERIVRLQTQLAETLEQSSSDLRETRSELHRAQQQVIQQERLKALGEMASGIAHDFNNALAPILGFSELMLVSPDLLLDREKVTSYLSIISLAAQDAASIVRRLREFYRRREGDELFTPVHLNALVEQAVRLTQPRWKHQALAGGRTIVFHNDLAPVPLVAGNPAELREVLTNLIFNSVDALPEGGAIRIRTAEEGSWVVLDYSDTGVGMSPDVLEHCLEPFFSTKGEHGSGLGLAMVYGIIDRHGGTVAVETAVGKGTRFTIRLPAHVEPAAEELAPGLSGAGRSLRILVVDDAPLARQVAAAYLTRDGHSVVEAESAREALQKFHAGRYDLVITDCAMPEMSGSQLAVSIKKVAPGKPVILLTGFGDMLAAAGELPEGIDCLVSKPVTLSELRLAVARACPPSGRPEQPIPALDRGLAGAR